eukprot:2526481-Ditylum_brightwellii.AAC.1
MNNNMKQDIDDFQKRQERQTNDFAGYISELSSKVISNTESWQKVESNLNAVTQTVTKLDHKIVMQKEIYSTQEKAIHDTEQVAMKLSEAYNKALAPKFHVPDSRFDNISKTLHDHDEELQNLMNK